jgi:hypothetical protein
MKDGGGLNSGFMYIRPTVAGARFLARALAIGRAEKGMRQQPAVNQAIVELAASKELEYTVR